LSSKSVIELTELLKQKNSALFDEMNESDRMNPRRLIRRIEIVYAGGTLAPKTTEITLLSRLTHPGGVCGQIDIQFIPFFHTDSEKTREIIRARVMARLDAGAVEETQSLLSEGYKATDPGLNAIGYQQIISYINNECTKEQMIELWLTREIQYAKRQKTFFKKYIKI
jgi:tRNA dimethylallyltransferase